MPVDVATVAALFAIVGPLYAALWSINRTIGSVDARTDHNEKSLEDIGSAVNRIEGAIRQSDELELTEP